MRFRESRPLRRAAALPRACRRGGRAGPRKRPQPGDQRRQRLDDAPHLVVRVAEAETEADGALRAPRRQPHRPQHVRRLERARRAGRAGRHGDPLEVERDQQRLGLDAVKADVGGVRHALAAAVDRRVGHRFQDRGFQPVAQRAQPGRLAGQLAAGQRRRHAEADDGRHVLGAGAPVPFLTPAGRGGGEARPAPDPECAGALRAVELVRRDREQIDAERGHVDRQLAGRLHGVGVEQGAVPVRDVGQLRDRLHRADLVVGVHHGDERRVAGDGRLQSRRLDDAGRPGRQQRRRPAPPGQRLQRVENRFVLDRGGDEVTASVRRRRLGDAADRQVVGFRSAAREDDVAGPGAEELRHRRARVVERRLGRLAERVDAGRVAEASADRFVHGVGDTRIDRGGGVMIQVDSHRRRS